MAWQYLLYLTCSQPKYGVVVATPNRAAVGARRSFIHSPDTVPHGGMRGGQGAGFTSKFIVKYNEY